MLRPPRSANPEATPLSELLSPVFLSGWALPPLGVTHPGPAGSIPTNVLEPYHRELCRKALLQLKQEAEEGVALGLAPADVVVPLRGGRPLANPPARLKPP